MTQPHYVVAPVRDTSNLAITSLIAGIAGWICAPVIASVVAVITGHAALRDVEKNNLNGRIQAIWGLVLGYAMLIPFIVVFLFFVIAAITGAQKFSTLTAIIHKENYSIRYAFG